MRQCEFKAKVKFALKKISKAVQCQRDNLQEFEIQKSDIRRKVSGSQYILNLLMEGSKNQSTEEQAKIERGIMFEAKFIISFQNY